MAHLQNQGGSIGDFAEHLLRGDNNPAASTSWDELSDDELIRRMRQPFVTYQSSAPLFSTVNAVESFRHESLGLIALIDRLGQETERRQLGAEEDSQFFLLRLLLNQLMQSGVKAVTMHEVGHTLGLRHNFK